MKEKKYITTADIIRDEPGILVQKTTWGHGAPVIRGKIGQDILLMYNGIRLNRPTFRSGGNQYMNTISPESIQRIEITRGPSSVLYGSDAIGGSVNMVTERYEPVNEGFRIIPSIKFDYSSADDGKNSSVYLKGAALNKFSYSGGFSYKKVGDLKPGDDSPRQKPTSWDESGGSFNLYFEPTQKHTFEFNYLNVNQNDVPRYDMYLQPRDPSEKPYEKWMYEPQQRQLYALTYVWSPPLSLIHRVKWNVSYQKEHEGRINQEVGSTKVRTDTDNIATTGTYLTVSSILSQKHWINTGFEYYYDKVRSKRIEVDGAIVSIARPAYPDNSEYNNFGVFLQDNYIINKQWDITAGIRSSKVWYETPIDTANGIIPPINKDTYKDITGFLGVGFEVKPSMNLVGTYSRGFRAPNFNETLVLKSMNKGYDAPSFGLNPEISDEFEIGVKVDNTAFRGGWFVYYNKLTNIIDRRPGTYKGLPKYKNKNVFQKVNVGNGYITGTELYSSYKWNTFTIKGNCFYTYGQNETANEPTSKVPPLTGLIGLRWDAAKKLWFEGEVKIAAKQKRLSSDDVIDVRIPVGGTPEYTVINLKSMIELPYGSLMIMFENIFDELYKTHASGVYFPGRSINISYSMTPPLPGLK
jgi:outer membrane receptor protein involved in Fe transport